MKTLQERLDEILVIRKKIRNLGLGVEIVPEIKPVFDHMTDFVKEGTTWTGSVYLDAADRYIDVILSNRKPFVTSRFDCLQLPRRLPDALEKKHACTRYNNVEVGSILDHV